jgi:hypothetical protein
LFPLRISLLLFPKADSPILVKKNVKWIDLEKRGHYEYINQHILVAKYL